MTDDELIQTYEQKNREFESLSIRDQARSPLRTELDELHPGYTAARERRRLEELREIRRAEEAKAEAERIAAIPVTFWLPPIVWILDGGYSRLSVTAQRMILPLYAHIDPGKPWSQAPLAALARCAGVSIRTAGAGLQELWRAGWIGKRYGRPDGQHILLAWFQYPPPGHRKEDPPEPDVLRSHKGDRAARRRRMIRKKSRARAKEKMLRATSPKGTRSSDEG